MASGSLPRSTGNFQLIGYMGGSTAGTYTLQLPIKGLMYVIFVWKSSTAAADKLGLYFAMKTGSAAVVTPVAACSDVTLTVDSTGVLTMTTTSTYMNARVYNV